MKHLQKIVAASALAFAFSGLAQAADLQIGKRGNVRVQAFDPDPRRAQARADALKAALVAGGVPAGRIQASGRKAPATAAKAAEVAIAL